MSSSSRNRNSSSGSGGLEAMEKNLNGMEEEVLENGVMGHEAGDDKSGMPGITNGMIASGLHPQFRLKKKAKRPSKYVVKDAENDMANGVKPLLVPAKNDRKPRNAKGRGLPKKGGAGGKGVWGKPGCEMDCEDGSNDVNDPNYDSDNQGQIKLKPVSPTLSHDEVEKIVTPVIHEYFEHGDKNDVTAQLANLAIGSNKSDIPFVAVSLAMDRHNPQRELVSELISSLYGKVLSSDQMAAAFRTLLDNLDDLTIDTPDAPAIVGKFIARAVADDCLPPKFVQSYKGHVVSDLVRDSLHRAEVLLGINHGFVRLDNVWGIGGGSRSVKTLVKKIILLLKEYLSSGDIGEATRCLKDLEVPHFHHELVYEAAVIVVEDTSEKAAITMAKLMKSLADSIIITPEQIQRGFIRVFDELTDICLDVPAAYNLCERYAKMCVACKVLDEKTFKEMPNRGRKRFVSEGDGGKVKETLLL